MPIVAALLDSLTTAVVSDLSSRYCPVDKSLFLERFGIAVAGLAAAAAVTFAFGRFARKHARRKELAYLGACAIGLFTLGYVAAIIFGLSGCGSGNTPGLTWDWPW